MTEPRAVGVHLAYDAVPEPVRAWVEGVLGSPVVRAVDQEGGMSPGCVSRLVCADGTRAFLKAVGAELNPDTPALYRREREVLGMLGSHPLWAGLVDAHEADGWVALLLEDVEGTHPDLRDDAVMARLLEATDELGAVMRERVPDPPVPQAGTGPGLFRPGLVDLSVTFTTWAEALDHVADVPRDLLPAWVVEAADDVRAGLLALAARPGRHLVHNDLRNDNLLVRPSGEVVFVDWGACGVGPAWLDPLLARAERVDEPWFDASLASSPPLAALGDAGVTAWLAGLGAYLAHRAHTATDVGLPTLREFRRRESRRLLDAAARRLDLDLGGRITRR
ncbi:hypothetical protein GCM10023340_22840 [Nocardioides marinquilinus]|uniref:Protein kinase domain-containing protein n=1 Tax=Nocardioides marinquilinus TaxID=1210400 RepID=A0ABP9PLS9_9ACTN